jgi:metal-dependent amidase/aminoacylase/carboxypeptidase family protein
VEGKESHTSKQNEGKDAIKLANKLLTFLYRYLDKQEQTIYLIGKINGGSMRNIVSSRVNIEMTLRNFNDEIYLISLDNVLSSRDKYKDFCSGTSIFTSNSKYKY